MAPHLKVAHIITRLELGGAQQNTLYCCAHHDRKKYEVLLITGRGGVLDPEGARIPGCKTLFLSELKHPLRPWWDFLAARRIAAILEQERVDIVHTHSSKAGILGRWAAKRAKVPVVIHTVHGWGFFKGQFFPVKFLYQALERWAAAFTDALITVSADNRREGLAAGIGKESQYRVIHSGIQPDRYRISAAAAKKARRQFGAQDRPVVLVLSNFKNQKSPLDVVKVAEALKTKMPRALFRWAGDGPLRGQVEGEIVRRGLGDQFQLLGWRKDPGELLGASDALLLTSLHEGLPRVVLQAMAAGKPVVATAVNGTPEAVRDGMTGFLHPPHAVEAMAESLFQILSRPSLGRKMGKAGRAGLKGSFLIVRMLQEIEKLYDELVRRKK